MDGLNVQGVVHWSIPVNDLEESEKFYGEVLGLESKGRLGGSGMSCFKAGDHHILLCVRKEQLVRTPEQEIACTMPSWSVRKCGKGVVSSFTKKA